jgi:hypothetical protein
MKHITFVAAAWLLSAAPAWAEDAVQADGDVRAVDVRSQVREALDARATPPAQPPRLPDSASDRAREVHATTAFGKKGAAERAAHEAAGKHAAEHARKARVDADQRGDRGASGAARSGNAESGSAAERDRTNNAKGKEGRGPVKPINPEPPVRR